MSIFNWLNIKLIIFLTYLVILRADDSLNDENRDGFLSFVEVTGFLQNLVEGEQSQEWLHDLFNKYDVDKDGYWNAEEKAAFRKRISSLQFDEPVDKAKKWMMTTVVILIATLFVIGRKAYQRWKRHRFRRMLDFGRRMRALGAAGAAAAGGGGAAADSSSESGDPRDVTSSLPSASLQSNDTIRWSTSVPNAPPGTPHTTSDDESSAHDHNDAAESIGGMLPISREASIAHRLSESVRTKLIRSEHLVVSSERLGAGRFGSVYKGKWQHTTNVACKVIHESESHEALLDFLAEAKLILELPSHPHIVAVYGVCHYDESALLTASQSELGSTQKVVLVMEYLEHGDLLTALRQPACLEIDWRLDTMLRFARDVAAGLIHLNAHGIVHRDLATRNLLLTRAADGYRVKLSDFGLSRSQTYLYASSPRLERRRSGAKKAGGDERRTSMFSSSTPSKRARPVPVKWTAPEALRFNEYSAKSDCWAYGICLWEMFTFGEEPFGGMTSQSVLRLLTELHREAQGRTFVSQSRLPFSTSSAATTESAYMETVSSKHDNDKGSVYVAGSEAYVLRDDGYVTVADSKHRLESQSSKSAAASESMTATTTPISDVLQTQTMRDDAPIYVEDDDCYRIPDAASISADAADSPVVRRRIGAATPVQRLAKLLPRPNECPDNVYELMLECWALNADERPSFQHIFERTITLLSEARAAADRRQKMVRRAHSVNCERVPLGEDDLRVGSVSILAKRGDSAMGGGAERKRQMTPEISVSSFLRKSSSGSGDEEASNDDYHP